MNKRSEGYNSSQKLEIFSVCRRPQDGTVSFASRGTGHRNRFKEAGITRGNLALSNSSDLNKTQLVPCNHEKNIPRFLYTSRIWPVKVMR